MEDQRAPSEYDQDDWADCLYATLPIYWFYWATKKPEDPWPPYLRY